MKIFLYILLLLITMSAVSAVTPYVISNKTTIVDIDYFDGYYYLGCDNCTILGIDNGLVRYNIATEGSTNYGVLGVGSYITENATLYDFNIYGRYGHHIYAESSNFYFFQQSVSGAGVGIRLYTYNSLTGYFQQSLLIQGTASSNDYPRGFRYLTVAGKPNYAVIQTDVDGNSLYSYRLNTSYLTKDTVLLAVESSAQSDLFKGAGLIIGHHYNYIYNTSNNMIYTSYNSLPSNVRNGWTDGSETVFITGTTVYTTNQTSNLSRNTDWTVFPNCINIRTIPNLNLQDIECKDINDCLIGGSYQLDRPLLFKYSDTGCEYVDLANNGADNGTVYSITYDNDHRQYVFVGKNVFGTLNITISTGNISGNYNITNVINQSLISSNPLCIPETDYVPNILSLGNYDCNNPLYINGVWQCTVFSPNVITRFFNAIGMSGYSPDGAVLFPCFADFTWIIPKTLGRCSYDFQNGYISKPLYMTNICNNTFVQQETVDNYTRLTFYCNIDDIHYCNLGCTNIVNTNNQIEGVCLQQAPSICSDNCTFGNHTVNLKGYSECLNTNYIGVCTLQSNGCLLTESVRSISCGNTSGVIGSSDGWAAYCYHNPTDPFCSSAQFCAQNPTAATCQAKSLSANTKLWIAIITIFLSLLFGVIMMVYANMSSGIISAVVIGVLVVEVIGFTISGYLSPWMITIIGLLAGGVLYVAIRTMLIGKHMDG